ncbi:uncharacterized protein LOC132546457 [Ylistrum balloti]|uniref:uncharacterized protein LOC132546457 n=1 Tax=Ylistrum balloti TaxID=509963 RepID=UPI002905AB79|nr:uncharacterized protein LOC132546457 [Ylistrum balloti]
MKKIDNIENGLKSLTGRVRVLEKEVRETKEKTAECEKSAETINQFYEQIKEKNEQNTMEIKRLQKQQELAEYNAKCAENRLMEVLETQESLRERVENVQCRSMKRNLIFHGIPETHNEEIEAKLKDFFHHSLKITKSAELANVHRFEKRYNDRPRPIVAAFLFQKDLELVRDSGRLLRGTSYGINEQFPKEVEERRKILYPALKDLKRAGHRV